MGVAIYYDSIDIVFLGRLIRSLSSVICVYGFCSFFANRPLEEKLNWLTNVLIVHAVIVVLSATLFIEMQDYLSVISDYHKRPRLLRSTGLMAGFDIAGLVCNVGVVVVLIKQKFSCIKFLIFVTAVIFTSRFSILTLFFFLTLFLIFLRKETGKFKFICVSIPLFIVGVIGFVLLALTTSGIVSETNLPVGNINIFDEIYWSYAQTDLHEATVTQMVFPETFLSLLFGLGFYGGGDPGYVRIINCVGLLGLLSIVLWHAFLFYNFFMAKIHYEEKGKKYFLGFFFIIVLTVLNFKNSYFFTGTIFELVLYVCYTYIISIKQCEIEGVSK
jgi:hypothetical protein